jgi:putative tryptophan/tyrosine transport system substrate-binding protein
MKRTSLPLQRREFITLLGSAGAVWPLAARAEQMRRVGVLMHGPATEPVTQAYVAAFVQALRQLGWIEGQNLRVDIRWNAGGTALGQIYAAQLIGLQPDVILAATTVSLDVVRQATSTVPVVFVQVSDPVVQGFVASLARPGGNLTGFSAYEFSTGGKWLDLLKEIAPGLAHAGVIFNPDMSPQSKFFMKAVDAAASSRGVRASAVPVASAADIEPAIAKFAREPNGGLILPTDTFTRLHQKLIIELAEQHRLPAISWDPEFPRAGGLMCYSVTVTTLDHYRQAAGYVDRILKGTKVGELPVQQGNKYTLVINLKTAKALGLTVPLPLLGLADEVIE